MIRNPNDIQEGAKKIRMLIAGYPGIGKSTLLTEVAGHLSGEHKVLYVSAEESCAQIKMRCDRLGVK